MLEKVTIKKLKMLPSLMLLMAVLAIVTAVAVRSIWANDSCQAVEGYRQ